MFSSTSYKQLTKMKVDILKYENDLKILFHENAIYFDKLISIFHSATIKDKNKFLEFCKENRITEEKYHNLYNYLYEAFTNLCLYNTSGLYGLFKYKNSDWGTLKVTLSKEDFPEFNADILPSEIIIYRGMSKQEYEKKEFSQHWTTDINIAKDFAFHTYSDMPKGIVVQAKIKKEDIIFYENDSHEKELIPIVEKIKNPILIHP